MESFQLAYSALTPVIVLTINIAQINHKLSITKYNLIILACQIQIILNDQIMNSQNYSKISTILILQFIYSTMIPNQSIQNKQQIHSNATTTNISIFVDAPLLNENQAFSFYTYRIYGSDMHGAFDVRRRYSDFDLLRKKLTQRWIGIYVPPISGKRAQTNPLYFMKVFESESNNKELRYTEVRRRFLKYFCDGIAIRPFYFYCDLFQIFIRSGPNFEITMTNSFSKDYQFILNAYEQSFKQLMTSIAEIDIKELRIQSQQSLQNMKQSQNKLNTICEQIMRTIQSREEFNSQFNHCMGKVFPDYQENFLLSHVDNQRDKLIINKNETFSIKLNQFKTVKANNPLQKFLQLIMYEIREIKAFIEGIEGRRQAERRRQDIKEKIQDRTREKIKLQSGAFSLRSMFKSGSKQLQLSQLQMKIDIMKKDLVCIDKMIVIMMLNANYELQQYRIRRGKEYAKLFKEVAIQQITQLQVYNELLKIPQLALS